MFEESCTGNSFLLDRLSIRNFTWRFWGHWERIYEENAQNCGDRVTGFSIMTAPAHTALSVTRYLASLGWTVVPHSPYSPDLAPCDFLLFPTIKKKHWKERNLPPWRRWKQLRRRLSTTSSFSSSRDASHSRKRDWTSVLPPVESILKKIKCFLFEM